MPRPDKSTNTLLDVARRAGVNKVTVSVVLNNARANTRVSDATRQRILDAASELKYRPNAVARSLRRRRTSIIGLYNGYGYTDLANPFLSQVIAGLQRGCKEFRQDLLLHGMYRGSSADDIYAELANGMIDALVLFAPSSHPLAAHLAESHLPAISIAEPVPGLPAVLVDDAGGARQQAEHLAERGHRWALFQAPLQPMDAAERRFVAFSAAAEQRGLKVTRVHAADFDGSLGPEAQRLLAPAERDRPTAIACWEDISAYRALSGCLQMGWRIPDEIAIVGFDGMVPFTEPLWKLTTVRAPWQEVAYTAMKLALDAVEGREVPERTVLPTELAVGNTS
jgi:DNA-binding LacI/PurR family transcriptional regulator